MAGPQDLECLFDVFLDVVKKHRAGREVSIQQLLCEKLTYCPQYPSVPAQRLYPR